MDSKESAPIPFSELGNGVTLGLKGLQSALWRVKTIHSNGLSWLGKSVTPAELSAALVRILEALVAQGKLAAAELPAEVVVERPKNREHGDWATNIAMQFANRFGLKPRELAELVAVELRSVSGVSAVDIAGPGFINITLEAGAAAEVLRRIVDNPSSYGQGDDLKGLKMNLEFVSANPTGPIHLGGTRWAAVGDALARVFEAQGAQVTREYYFNDHGAQIDRFARSLLAAARGLAAPEDGYLSLIHI